MARTHGKRAEEAREKEAKALELRRAGVTYDVIAAQVGWADAATANKAVRRAIARSMQDDVEAVREIELDRLDRLERSVWANALQGDLGSVRAVLNIMERRAKMLGIDAPAKVSAEVTAYQGGTDIDREVERLAETLALLDSQRQNGVDPTASKGQPEGSPNGVAHLGDS